MRAAIIGSAPLRAPGALRSLVRKADLVICADGGVHAAHALGVAPHVVIGDLDSAPPRALQWARARGAALLRFPVEKDQTDTELATDYALDAGASEIAYVGVLGGRVDHSLANVGLLSRAAARRCRARIIDGPTEIYLANRHTAINGVKGDQVSLLPLGEPVEGITTQGLKYALHNGTLSIGSTLGVSNEIVMVPAAVRAKRGSLLVIVTHRRLTKGRST